MIVAHLQMHSATLLYVRECVRMYVCPLMALKFYPCVHLFALRVGRHVSIKHHRLLEQPVPRSFLTLQYKVRQIATKLKTERRPPVMRETVFR